MNPDSVLNDVGIKKYGSDKVFIFFVIETQTQPATAEITITVTERRQQRTG